MTFLLSLITALAISMTVIPVMARFAPRIGMIDRPDPRKVHAIPTPRAGGIGIVLGALVPVAFWAQLDALTATYLFGAVVLLIFGVWDDIQELGHYVKFIGQFIAVVPVVYYGNLYVTHLPFAGLDAIPASIGQPFTVFAIMGMINAINHSDGLDGLAGGLSLLSLGCMSYLAFLAGSGDLVLLIALATVGGVFGFLRYNTHPARVFMGDGGSQFLGFTLGYLVIYLLEKTNNALSPALPALILGLPIVDILAVFVQRIYHGMNWFRASKNHIHHRLLQLGFDHYEAVIIIYSAQILLVAFAILFSYESDMLILSIYLGVCVAIFGFLIVAEQTGWRAHKASRSSGLTGIIQAVKRHKMFNVVPINFLTVAIPLFFVAVSLLAVNIPRDISMTSAILALILLLYMLLRRNAYSVVVQVISYVTAAFVVYLETKYTGNWSPLAEAMEFAYFAAVAISVGVIVRYDRKGDFRSTPMDYLVICIVLSAGFLFHNLPEKAYLGSMSVKLIVLFYGCELFFMRMRGKASIGQQYVFNLPVLLSLSLIALKGLAFSVSGI